MSTPSTLRLFFALCPDDATRARLSALARAIAHRCATRPTQRESLHLTLGFLGSVEQARVPELIALASELRSTPFDLILDEIGVWRHNHIAWLAPTSIPPALSQLVRELRRRLKAAGSTIEDRDYAPHLTLARKAGPLTAQRMVEPIEWRVEEFALVRSQLEANGSRYAALARWPLWASGDSSNWPEP